MTRYLLDTNVLSDLVRNPAGRIAQRIMSVGEASVCTSVIVAAELRYGAAKKGSAKLSRQVEAILAALEILPIEVPADETYARVRVELEASGQPIGANDLLICAQALSLGYTVVTDNEREFSRIHGLKTSNWLRERAVE